MKTSISSNRAVALLHSMPLRVGVVAAWLAVAIVAAADTGTTSRARPEAVVPGVGTTLPVSRHWWRTPMMHMGTMEEAFLRAMPYYYGPLWLHWLPDAVIQEHWNRFPGRFGAGQERSFLQWMNLRFGAGWQARLPAPSVYQGWLSFNGGRAIPSSPRR